MSSDASIDRERAKATEARLDKSRSLLEAVEGRRRQAETFAWTAPGLALTGQALLLTVALDAATSPRGRLVASVAGILTIFAALHFLAKMAFTFDMYEAVIERERVRLGWPRLYRDELLRDLRSFPPDTLLRKRQWWRPKESKEPKGGLFVRGRRWVAMRGAVTVWVTVFGLLLALDFAIGLRALCNL